MEFHIKTLALPAIYKLLRRNDQLVGEKMWIIAAICLTALVAVTTAQPECSELGFQDRSPFTGASLSICRSEGAQCCSDDYLDELKEEVQDKLEDYLEEEFEDVIEEYEDEIEDLMEYFTEEFTENMLLNFPFSELLNRTDPIIQRILRKLIRNFVIRDDEDDEDEEESDESDEDEDEVTGEEEGDESDDDDFDVSDFLRELIRAIIRAIARGLGERAECIVDAVESLLDEDVIGQLIRLLRRIRRAITALTRIGRFLERQKDRFEDAEILQSCVSRFIEIAYCKRCTQKTPPMCFRTCNALVRGCYSPYYTVLNAQYRRLWEEVQTIVELANRTVSEFFSRENALMDRSAVVRMLLSECRVRVSDDDSRGSRNKRDHSDSSPSHMSTKKTDSTDSQYSGSGSGSGEEKSRSRSDTSMTKTTMTKTTMTRTTKTRTSKTRTSKTGTSKDTTGNTDSSSRPKPNPEEPPELPESIPFEVVDDVLALTSAFQYGMRRRNVGLKLCLNALIEDDDESCNKTDDDQEYCKGKEFCTSRCYCTDGKIFTMDDETDQTFDSNEVDDQGNNPVLGIDEEELQEEVDRISEMGDPVQAFLVSDEFTSVDPRQQDEEDSGGDDGEVDDGDNSATGLGVGTLSVLLLAALTVFL